LVLAAALAIASCDPPRISSAEVVGHWRVSDPKGIRDARKYGGGSLDLRGDGAFTASHVPFDPLDDEGRATDLNGSGNWKILDSEGRQSVILDFDMMGGRPRIGGFGLPLDIAGGPAHRTLYIYRGDPDNGDRLDFRRDMGVR
jgi:hypothetical protein